MHDMIAAGKALYWGTSEWSAAEIMAAWQIAERHHLHKPVMEQPQYNLLHRDRVEKEYARLYARHRARHDDLEPARLGPADRQVQRRHPGRTRAATLKGYEWLAERLTDPAKIAVVRRLAPIAADLGCTLAQLSLAWCLKNPHVSTVITGASRPSQVAENMQRARRRRPAHARRDGAHRHPAGRLAGAPHDPMRVSRHAAGHEPRLPPLRRRRDEPVRAGSSPARRRPDSASPPGAWRTARARPNCVSSTAADPEHFVDPLRHAGAATAAMLLLVEVVRREPGARRRHATTRLPLRRVRERGVRIRRRCRVPRCRRRPHRRALGVAPGLQRLRRQSPPRREAARRLHRRGGATAMNPLESWHEEQRSAFLYRVCADGREPAPRARSCSGASPARPRRRRRSGARSSPRAATRRRRRSRRTCARAWSPPLVRALGPRPLQGRAGGDEGARHGDLRPARRRREPGHAPPRRRCAASSTGTAASAAAATCAPRCSASTTASSRTPA